MAADCKRASWSGQLAFVLAASASAIGLGNLWRFPYLAAQYGGGTFIFIYLVLVVTLGFALMMTEIAIGRKTRQSQLTAYARLKRGWGGVGVLGTIVPLVIAPYYCVIGGWVVKYFVTYCRIAFAGAAPLGVAAADSGAFFNAFIASDVAPLAYALVFLAFVAFVVLLGVKNGIERSNVILMPVLFALAIGMALYVVFLPGTGEGLKYYLVPSLDALSEGGVFSLPKLGRTLLGAMGQMFYSGSLAMGIMITYGSYMQKRDSIVQSVWRIEFFDTFIALVAGLMIVPVVHMFAVRTGVPVKEAMNAGAGLMFITLPKVFATLGAVGDWLGVAFFLLVVFAALTSAISLYEASLAAVCDLLPVGRKAATLGLFVLMALLAALSALGYGSLDGIRFFATAHSSGLTFLEFFDFVTNSVLMPIVAALTCVFVGWVIGPKAMFDEIEADGRRFNFKTPYAFLVRYFAPVLILLILVQKVCELLGVNGWAI